MNIYGVLKDIKSLPYNIKYGIKNLVKWLPVIWKDRDWDQYYFYTMLHRKLKHMEEFFASDRAMALHSEKEAKKIRICVTLLDRIIKDEYDESAFKEHHKKWGKPEFSWGDEYFDIKHKNVITDEDKKKERKGFLAACEHEKRMKTQDIRYLFDYIGKHIECWWD